MFEKIRKMKNQKGFTLVELIVVLVILAILAALLVPALTGYIDKANKEKVIATTRMVVMAAQPEASEKYGLKADGKLSEAKLVKGDNTIVPSDVTAKAKTDDGLDIDVIAKLAEVAKDGKDKDNNATVNFVNGVTAVYIEISDKGVVTTVKVAQSGFTCTYKASPETGKDKYTVTDTRSK